MNISIVLFVLLSSIIVSPAVFSQDERYFHKIYNEISRGKGPVTPYKWSVPGKVYKLDLDQDGAKEGIVVEYRDQSSWFNVYEGTRKVFEYKIEATGIKSRLYRIRLKTLSHNILGIVLYFYEGYTKYLSTHSVSRFYFGAIYNKNLRDIKMIRGPHFFEERQDWLENYEQNSYNISFFDYNRDGIKDIAVKNRLVSRVYFFLDSRRNWFTY